MNKAVKIGLSRFDTTEKPYGAATAYTVLFTPHFRLHISTKSRSGAAPKRGIDSITPSLVLLMMREYTHS